MIAKINMKRSLRIAMAKADLNQQGTAVASGISQSHISIIIRTGICTTETLQRLSNGLSLRPSELLALGET